MSSSEKIALRNQRFFVVDVDKRVSDSSSRKVQLQKSEDKRTALVAFCGVLQSDLHIIIMVIFKCYFSREHIALSF